jgi:hypothetical protein
MWIHPEGQVIGSIYLRKQSIRHAGPEQPLEAFNHEEPFIVFMRDQPNEMRFYNRRAIIRVEFSGKDYQVTQALSPIHCEIHLMDGSLITGKIEEPLHPIKARLLDYLNYSDGKFIKISSNENTVLVNKAYIVRVHVDELSVDERSNQE